MHPVRTRLIAAAIVVGTAALATAQLRESRKSRTTASKADYKTSYGSLHNRPRNYDQHYLNARNGYALSPYLALRQVGAVANTPMAPYSALEYGMLMSTSLESDPVAASSETREGNGSILQAQPGPGGLLDASVAGVLDRGVILLKNGEQVRLRGIRIPANDANDVNSRVVAREAAQRLQQLTNGSNIYLLLDQPVRDKNGVILVTAYLADGTDLNQLVLQEGLGRLQADDFAPEVQYGALKEAEAKAKQDRVAIWAR